MIILNEIEAGILECVSAPTHISECILASRKKKDTPNPASFFFGSVSFLYSYLSFTDSVIFLANKTGLYAV